jgi:hypothetical protein
MIGAESEKRPEPEAEPNRVRFDYIKSASFRVIHVDGVVGGLTPRLDVHMDFWSERFPIPQQVVHRVNADGNLGDEIKPERKTREAIVREVEAGVVMDLDTARAFRDWLNDRIAEIEQVLAERKPKPGKP